MAGMMMRGMRAEIVFSRRRNTTMEFVHHPNALRSAIAHALQARTHRPVSEKSTYIKAKAPEYGAFRIISKLFVTSHLKLARPLQ